MERQFFYCDYKYKWIIYLIGVQGALAKKKNLFSLLKYSLLK